MDQLMAELSSSALTHTQGLPVGGFPGAGLHRATPARRERAGVPRPLCAADAHPRVLLACPLHRAALRLHWVSRRLCAHLRWVRSILSGFPFTLFL